MRIWECGWRQIENIFCHQDLTVAFGRSTNANGRNAQCLCNAARQGLCGAFDHHSKGAGLFLCQRILIDDFGRFI